MAQDGTYLTGSHSFTFHTHVYPLVDEPFCLTPQPQSIPALWSVHIFRPAAGRRLSWPGWRGKDERVVCPLKADIHSSTCTNRARRTATSLMQPSITVAPRHHLEERKAIASVCLSVCLSVGSFPLHLRNRPKSKADIMNVSRVKSYLASNSCR